VGIPVIPVRLLPLLSVVAAGYSLPAYRFVLAEMPENLVSCAVWGSGGAAAAADGGWGLAAAAAGGAGAAAARGGGGAPAARAARRGHRELICMCSPRTNNKVAAAPGR
jgi:hypothetical protein